MARPKLADTAILKDFGIKLHDNTIAEIEALAEEWDMKKSTAARELLLLGLAVIKASQHSKLIKLAPGLQFIEEPPADEPSMKPIAAGKG